MSIPNQHWGPAPAPGAAAFSAAMTVLGAYGKPPTARELEQQARAVGGEHVLAAILANALYGAAIRAGIGAEGHMLAQGGGGSELALARQQVVKSLGAQGPGVMGALRWQSGQVSHLLKALDERGCGPVIVASARTASALLALLSCSAVFSTDEERAGQAPAELDRARRELNQASAELDGLSATAAAMFLGVVPGL